MKHIKAELRKENDKGILEKIGDGVISVYSPTASNHEPYVSFNMGKYRIHFDKKDFEELCKEFVLYDRLLKGN